ncbi:hypothetical protein GQ53DRAFT_26013 [Thozetella sp. PMI_491]|nr:hypothetical protein GQ53DRAFT_26013 [Thozetella sp. PMI_491]
MSYIGLDPSCRTGRHEIAPPHVCFLRDTLSPFLSCFGGGMEGGGRRMALALGRAGAFAGERKREWRIAEGSWELPCRQPRPRELPEEQGARDARWEVGDLQAADLTRYFRTTFRAVPPRPHRVFASTKPGQRKARVGRRAYLAASLTLTNRCDARYY